MIKRYLFAIYKVIFLIMGRVLSRKSNLIVFESFLGKQYSDNPRAIYEYLHTNYPQYNLVWSVDKTFVKKFDELNIPYIKRFSIKWMYCMNRASYWVSNSRLPLWIHKPPNTIYIQTWHGTPLKRLGVDIKEVQMPGTNTEQYKRNFTTEAKKWDYLLSANEYSTNIFEQAFQYDNKIIETGYPRNDYLINYNTDFEIKRIKNKLGIPIDKKVLLYAPTWRDNQYYGRGRYRFDINLDLEKMRNQLSDDYIVLLRMHYLIAENIDTSRFESFAYDVSYHDDIRELYLIADMLITDYSSVFFDFAILKRPILFYVYDINDYRDNVRGFYFDFEAKAPGPLVKTTKELIENIKRYNNHKEPTDNFKEFYSKYCYLEDGNATQRVVESIFLKKHK